MLGGGAWGSAFSGLATAGGPVTLVVRDADRVADVADGLTVTTFADEDALVGAAVVACAVPSRAVAEVASWAADRMDRDAAVLCLTKGLDPASGRRLSQVWLEVVAAGTPYCVLTGPNHAEEIADGQPAAAVIAGDDALAHALQARLASPTFRPYVNQDLLGAELCGAAKNVIAVAAGMGEGIGLGDNARAAVITRGLAEMTRLGVACGADADTFRGLAGVGDLVATCLGRYSRNRRAGELLALGVAVGDVERELGQVAEGLWTARNLVALADDVDVELPICREVLAALDGKDPRACLHDLMTREPRPEV
mgnify:CR=1 FL=1